jgi:hypothetical protein
MSHEYGHISSLSKVCACDPVLGRSDGDPSAWRPLNPGRLFLQGLSPVTGSVVSASEEDWDEIDRRFAGRPDAHRRMTLMMEAGGFNQEQVLVSRYGARARDGALSFLDTPAYLWTAIGTIRYPKSVEESDLEDYTEGLEGDGIEASSVRVKALSALRLAGGSGLAAAWGLATGLATGKGGSARPLSIEPAPGLLLFWPEFESHLTQAGPTVRTTSPLRVGGWEFLPSVERSFAEGGEALEGGLRIRAPLYPYLHLDGAAYAGDRGGRWGSLVAELRPLPWAAVTLGVEGGRDYTFQRDIYGAGNDFLDPSERSLLVGLRIFSSF